MFEKVNPSHPDKLADRIAGALVDMAYAQERDPRIAVEVLVGHGECNVIAETSAALDPEAVAAAARRIVGVDDLLVRYREVPQDSHLARNQQDGVRCGDNGVFKGMPVTDEQRRLTDIAKAIYGRYPADGKYVMDGKRIVICQSNASSAELRAEFPGTEVNPLGDWTGGPAVDSGATNRKLGSDMGDSVTGGGLHGKDLSKADVSLNIYAWLLAQERGRGVEISCAIGDATVLGKPYGDIVEIARDFIRKCGGFEGFAEWGLIR